MNIDKEEEKIQREIFSNNLKYWINAKGKEQVDIANIAGVSRAAVTCWCNGSKMPRMGKIQAIADYLGILKSDLLENKSNLDNTYLINTKSNNISETKQKFINKVINLDEETFDRYLQVLDLIDKED
ncbi:MAG: helix-turn-helix domain-containing protein [Eubacterium sp.]|nr:helix-turn-helix domain-containing protein [Eubacterium sp.]